jgi:putative membrane protein
VEWWAALIGGEGADAFLGTQGDQWDTQWDMFVALLGAATALLALTRLPDRQIATLEEVGHVRAHSGDTVEAGGRRGDVPQGTLLA